MRHPRWLIGSLVLAVAAVTAQTGRPAARSGQAMTARVLDDSQLTVGQPLPGFDELVVCRPDGSVESLKALMTGHPTVIVSGCLTCPVFLRTFPGSEALALDYGQKVTFYYLYKSLAHPENSGYVQAYTIDERLLQARQAVEKLQVKIPFLIDPLDNQVKHALGGAPNSAFLFDEAGNVLHYEPWFDEAALRAELARRYGEVAPATSTASLNLPQMGHSSIATGLLPRVTIDERLIPLKLDPQESADPFYGKLRAEATGGVLQSGTGKLYVGFHMDPVYDVHWNNLAKPLTWSIELPEGVTLEPATAAAPKLEVATDNDPREFLVDVKQWPAGVALTLKVDYFACDGAGTWCKQFQQRYVLLPERDPDGGAVQGRPHRAGGNQATGPGNFAGMDRDGDGKISRDEVPERMLQRWDRMDANGDGFLDAEEQAAVAERIRRSRRR